MILLGGVLFYLTGLWFGPFLVYFPLSGVGALLLLALVLAWLEFKQHIKIRVAVLWFAIGLCGLGQTFYASNPNVPSDLVRLSSGKKVLIQGIIAAPIRHIPDGVILLLYVDSLRIHRQSYDVSEKIRLTWRQPDRSLKYGDRVQVLVRLREPFGTLNPGGFHYGSYLKQRGIQAVGSIQGEKVLTTLSNDRTGFWTNFLGKVDSWRHQVYLAAVNSLSPPALGLFLGMIIGEQTYIEQHIRDAFMAGGTVHILSISGSHLGILALGIFMGVRVVFLCLPARWLERISLILPPSRLAILLTVPVVTFYSLLAGAEMATVRSWIMIVVGCVGLWLGRERNLFAALAVAALLMLVPNPEAIRDLSFQLSYLSVVAIGFVLWSQEGVQESVSQGAFDCRFSFSPWFDRLLKNCVVGLRVTVGVSLVTLPLVAYHFHQIPWMGVWTNMIIVPLVGFVVVPIGLFSGVGGLVMGTTTLPMAGVNQWVFEGVADLVVGLSMVPGSLWFVSSPHVLTIILFWAALTLFMVAREWIRVRGCCLVLVAGIFLWWGWSPRLSWEPGELRVTFLDVGQGDATFLELPDGQTVLIDGGPAYRRLDMGRAVIGPYLFDQGIVRLDHVVATHPQWDHVGGLPWVLQNFDVGRYWSNGISRPREFYARLQNAVEVKGIPEGVLGSGDEILHSDVCSLRVLSPAGRPMPEQNSSSRQIRGRVLNNYSLVTKLTCGQHSLLFTADAEWEALDALRGHPEGIFARVTKVPHHGAKSSLHDDWVKQLQTEALVVSVGRHNRYGHPAREVVAAYGKRGIPFYRTDQDGAVIIEARLDSSELNIRTAQQAVLVPVSFDRHMWKHERENWNRIWSG